MSHKPEAGGGSSRVSPTAPDDHSRSTNVWRLLESKRDFLEGMAQARSEHERGEFKPFNRKNPRPR